MKEKAEQFVSINKIGGPKLLVVAEIREGFPGVTTLSWDWRDYYYYKVSLCLNFLICNMKELEWILF